MKASLPSRLQQIRTFGSLPLEEYTKLIFAEDIKICETEKSKHETWYSLMLDIFVAFLYKVRIKSLSSFSSCLTRRPKLLMVPLILQKEISAATDDDALQYKETTLVEDRIAPGIWLAMTKAQQKMVKLIRAKNFDKYIAMANPKNGDAFFDEVSHRFPFYS